MKFGLYIRKSSEDSGKQIQSLDDQRQTLQELAAREDLHIVKVYEESKSAKKPFKRKAYLQMIRDLEEGQINGIICWKLCRLSRNPLEGGQIMQYLQEGIIKEIVTFDKRYYPRDNSLMMSIELGMATEYSRALSDNTKRGQRYKVNKGNYPNQAPIGYINTIDRAKGEKSIEPDPERFHMVRKLWDVLLEEELPVLQILEKANDKGLNCPPTKGKPSKPLSKTGLYKLFRSPFYYGSFKWSGELHEGNHKPMITKAEFEEAQEIIDRRDRPKKFRHKFAFTGLVACGECSAGITAEYKNKARVDGTINRRTYYRCTKKKGPCSQVGIREEEFEKQFAEILDSVTIPESFVKWAIKWLHEESEEDLEQLKAIRKEQTKRLDKLNDQIQRLLDMRLEGEIDQDTFKMKKEVLEASKRPILKEMELGEDSRDHDVDKTVEVLEFCKEAKRLFETGTKDDKKLVLQTLGSRFYLKDKELSVELAKPFQLIKEGNESGLTLNSRFATLETRIAPEFNLETCGLIKNGGGGGELPPSSRSAPSRTNYERSLVFRIILFQEPRQLNRFCDLNSSV